MPAQPLTPGSDLLQATEREAAEVLPAPPGNPRYPLMDSLRAIAAISVMLVHVGIFTGGFAPWYKQLFAHLDIGVPFFFLLSGFLLYRPMLAARTIRTPRQKLRNYARNRFMRIAPLYWLVLTVAAIVPGFYGAFTSNWWVYYGLLQHLPIYTPTGSCAIISIRCGVPPTWSLGIEMLFYISLPFYSFGLAQLTRLVGRRRWLATEIFVLILLSAWSLWIQREIPVNDLGRWLFSSPIGRGYWFALGMGLAVASVAIQKRGRTPALVEWISDHPNVFWIAGAALYAFTSLVVLEPTPSLAAPLIQQSKYLFSVVAFGLVAFFFILPAVFGFDRGGFVRRLLQHPTLVWLGLISYGIFLWHYPVLIGLLDIGVGNVAGPLQFPVVALSTFVCTVALSALTFYTVERPLMLWSRRVGARNS